MFYLCFTSPRNYPTRGLMGRLKINFHHHHHHHLGTLYATRFFWRNMPKSVLPFSNERFTVFIVDLGTIVKHNKKFPYQIGGFTIFFLIFLIFIYSWITEKLYSCKLWWVTKRILPISQLNMKMQKHCCHSSLAPKDNIQQTLTDCTLLLNLLLVTAYNLYHLDISLLLMMNESGK